CRRQSPQAVLRVLGRDVILGYELARQLGARASCVDGARGGRTLRARFQVKTGEHVLILMGVIVTGDSARGLMRLVTAAGGQVTGVDVLVDRRRIPLRLGVPVEPIAVFVLETYYALVCPF